MFTLGRNIIDMIIEEELVTTPRPGVIVWDENVEDKIDALIDAAYDTVRRD